MDPDSLGLFLTGVLNLTDQPDCATTVPILCTDLDLTLNTPHFWSVVYLLSVMMPIIQVQLLYPVNHA